MESKIWGFNSCDLTERMMESPINPQPRWIEPTAWSTQPLPPPSPPASSTAWSSSSSPPVSMEDILARIARLEARLETSERRCAPAFTPSRGEADMSFGAQRDWRVPSWDPGSHPSPQSWQPPLPQQAPWDSPWLRSNHEPPRPDPDPLYGMPTTWRLSTWETQSTGFYQPIAPSDVVQPPLGFRQPSPAPQPSLADPHVPWESPWQPSHAPPSLTESVPCPVAEEAADSKGLGATENQDPRFVPATSGSGIGEGNPNNAVESSAADDELEKTLESTSELMARGPKAVKECDYSKANESYGHTLDIKVARACVLEGVSVHYKYGWAVHYKCGWALLYQAQEKVDFFGFIPNKKGEGLGKERLKSREVSRRSVVFGFYALEEVYKDLSNLHLEDKVILKGGGVDT